jgi:hypothetical protein
MDGFEKWIIGLIVGTILLFTTLITVNNIKEAEFINREFGTSYSAWDMFWNGDTIKEIVIGKKNRIDLED